MEAADSNKLRFRKERFTWASRHFIYGNI